MSNCERPFINAGGAYGCGQCIPCRVTKRRTWTHRIMLEAALHDQNAFVTLTFRDDALPKDNSVSPRDLQLFLKKLRRSGASGLRYFGCGEYGDTSGRPHYHLALFNYPSCHRGITKQNKPDRPFNCCPPCNAVYKAWGLGGITLGLLEESSAAYIAGYVTKKMTRHDDPRLEGRLPEFARMSLKPGIGLGMMHEVASTLLEHNLHEKITDVPVSLSHGKKQWPLGRYLRRNLRKMIGRDEKTPQEVLEHQKQTLQPLREIAYNNSSSLKTEVLNASRPRRIQIEARYNRYRKRGSI